MRKSSEEIQQPVYNQAFITDISVVDNIVAKMKEEMGSDQVFTVATGGLAPYMQWN